jgi:hypothetical protein
MLIPSAEKTARVGPIDQFAELFDRNLIERLQPKVVFGTAHSLTTSAA